MKKSATTGDDQQVHARDGTRQRSSSGKNMSVVYCCRAEESIPLLHATCSSMVCRLSEGNSGRKAQVGKQPGFRHRPCSYQDL